MTGRRETKKIDFRHVLRDATRLHHERVDHLISSMDVATARGFTWFLELHKSCFERMRDIAGPGSHAQHSLDQMLGRINSDLQALDASGDVAPAPELNNVDALAIDYMIEGSRLGSQVLKRRWATAGDTKVSHADAYFSMELIPSQWGAVCERLSAISAGSKRADKIAEDVKVLFDMFYVVAKRSTMPQPYAMEATS